MEIEKEYNNIENQVKTLEDRGMIVNNPDILKKVNYAHLIYKYGFHYAESHDKNNKPRYKERISLSHVYNRYLFNAKLSSVLYRGISQLEHQYRFAISYVIAETEILPQHNHFTDKKGATNKKQVISQKLTRFVKELLDIEKIRKYLYDQKYLTNDKMPIWLLIDELMFKQLCDLEKLSKKAKEIRKYLTFCKNKSKLPSGIKTIHHYRNLIAHFNPIVPYVAIEWKNSKSKNGINKYPLSRLLSMIKHFCPEVYKDFFKIITNKECKKFSSSKADFLKYLKIKKK